MSGESARKRIMHTHAIRAMLLGSEDGLTSSEMARALGITTSYANGILNDTYGMYIDRWADTGSTMAAVWVCVPVPPNCPRPEPRKRDEE